jgi:prepilin-type N-terminal cleavage/methylation domain-containing protein
MKNSTQLKYRMLLKSGFTLVELAVVIIVIGLLVGGVLQGLELIRIAKLSKVMQEMREIIISVNTFYSKYDALPGDFSKASTFFDPSLQDGNNDGRMMFGETAPTHLYAASLVKSLTTWPDFFSGRAVKSTYEDDAGFGITTLDSNSNPGIENGNYIIMAKIGLANLSSGNLNILNSEDVFYIDSKLDDGKPFTGIFRDMDNGGNIQNCALVDDGNVYYAAQFFNYANEYDMQKKNSCSSPALKF